MSDFCNIEIHGSGNNIGKFIFGNVQIPTQKRSYGLKSVKKYKGKGVPNLPDLAKEIVITDHDYQKQLIVIIRYLVKKGIASISGRYIKGAAKTPLFRDKEKQGIEVFSVDKKTGQRLLKGQYLSRPDSVNKLLIWIIEKFSVVQDMAETAYKKELDKNEQRAHIIVGAALFIDSLKSSAVDYSSQ